MEVRLAEDRDESGVAKLLGGPLDSSVGRQVVVVAAVVGSDVVGVLVADFRRRSLLATSAVVAAGDTSTSLPRSQPGPPAWPSDLADRTAGRRWRDRHRKVGVLTHLVVAQGAPGATAASLLAEAAAPLVASGARRLDVRLDVGDPAADLFVGAGWFGGTVDHSVVLSTSLAFVWPPVVGSKPSRLPRPVARTIRRARGIDPRSVPGLAATLGEELVELARRRQRPEKHPPEPVAGAPVGSAPHAATRFRTIREALDCVSPAMRATVLLDVGCGSGRVLDVAARSGFTRLAGVDVDAGLVERAMAVLGPAAALRVGDATEELLDPEVGVVYLNNPFGVEAVTRLAGRIHTSLDAHPRPFVVLYTNPRSLAPFEDIGFVLVHQSLRTSVLVAAA